MEGRRLMPTPRNPRSGLRADTPPRADSIAGFPRPPDWYDDAACGKAHPEDFFPENNDARKAKKVCNTKCEVKTKCLAYALDNGPLEGIWGGLSVRERNKLKPRSMCRVCGTVLNHPGHRYCLTHRPVEKRIDRPHGQAVMRRWAKEQGIPVTTVGNIQPEVIQQYLDAHPDAEDGAA